MTHVRLWLDSSKLIMKKYVDIQLRVGNSLAQPFRFGMRFKSPRLRLRKTARGLLCFGGSVRLLFSSALLSLLLSSPVVRSQQSAIPQPTPVPQHDAQATNVIQAAIKALGGAAPADATATGTITVTVGPDTETGNIQIFARGTTQTLELITTPSRTIRSVY